MLKLNKKIFVIIFTLLLSISFSFITRNSFALTERDIVIHLKNGYEIRKGVELNIFKVESEKSDLELIEELKSLDKVELEKRFGPAKFVVKSDDNGIIALSDLEYGIYYAVEFSEVEGAYVTVPFIFRIPTTIVNREIFIKVVENNKIPIVPEEKGGKKFRKISSDEKKVLKGASFKVMRFQNGEFVPVLKDGKNYIVTSDDFGNFSVEDLVLGKYFLWEVNAPKGYSPLKEAIEFEVSNEKDLVESEVIAIKNFPTIPPKIPNTGDITFFVLMIGGLILFSLGYYMTREEKNMGIFK